MWTALGRDREAGDSAARPEIRPTGRRHLSRAKPTSVGFFLDLQMVFYSAHAVDLHRQLLGARLLIG